MMAGANTNTNTQIGHVHVTQQRTETAKNSGGKLYQVEQLSIYFDGDVSAPWAPQRTRSTARNAQKKQNKAHRSYFTQERSHVNEDIVMCWGQLQQRLCIHKLSNKEQHNGTPTCLHQEVSGRPSVYWLTKWRGKT